MSPQKVPFRDRYPRAASEFLENLTRPGVGPDVFGVNAADHCKWRCADHAVEWVTTPLSRGQARTPDRATGCPECARARISATRRTQPRTAALPETHPHLLGEILRNVTSPGRDLAYVTQYSRDIYVWKCARCGHDYQASIAARAQREDPCCSNCGTGRAVSLLDLQVAALVALRTGLTVRVGEVIRGVRPDLYVVEWRTGFDLDPRWSHQHREHGDVRKRSRARQVLADFYRVREVGLPLHQHCDLHVPAGAALDDWADAVVGALAAYDVPNQVPDAVEREVALQRAAMRWASTRTAGQPTFADRFPELAAQFVANLDRPGVGPDVFAPASNFRCAWKCAHGVERLKKAQKAHQAGSCPDCRAVVEARRVTRYRAAVQARWAEQGDARTS